MILLRLSSKIQSVVVFLGYCTYKYTPISVIKTRNILSHKLVVLLGKQSLGSILRSVYSFSKCCKPLAAHLSSTSFV